MANHPPRTSAQSPFFSLNSLLAVHRVHGKCRAIFVQGAHVGTFVPEGDDKPVIYIGLDAPDVALSRLLTNLAPTIGTPSIEAIVRTLMEDRRHG